MILPIRYLFSGPPLSANEIWRVSGKRAVRSHDYRAYCIWAKALMRNQDKLAGRQAVQEWPMRLQFILEAHIDRRRDLDNCIKPALDIMARHLLFDDRRVRKIIANAIDAKPDMQSYTVTLLPIP